MAVEVAEIAGLGKGQGSRICLRRRRALLELVVEQELGQGQVLIEMLVLVLLVNLVLVLLVVLVWMTAVV